MACAAPNCTQAPHFSSDPVVTMGVADHDCFKQFAMLEEYVQAADAAPAPAVAKSR